MLEEGVRNKGKNVLPRTEEDSPGPNEGRNTVCTMSMYTMTDGLDRVIQATMPIPQVVETLEPTCQGLIMETDEASESSMLSEVMESSEEKSSPGEKKDEIGKRMMNVGAKNMGNAGGKKQIAKNVPITTSSTPWEIACD